MSALYGRAIARKHSSEVPLKVSGDLDNVTITVPIPTAADEKGPPVHLMVGTEPSAN